MSVAMAAVGFANDVEAASQGIGCLREAKTGKDRHDESERRQPFREPLRARPDPAVGNFSAMNSRRS
jgi:hypothetical protein